MKTLHYNCITPTHLVSHTSNLFQSAGGVSCIEQNVCYSLVEIDTFLCELSSAICWVFKRLVLHHLHALASLALLVAVLADHVQLPDPVLETKATTQLQLQPVLQK